jgi:PAS domain S-box-containing protein
MISVSAAYASSYDYGEVARSVLIAIAASYVALDLTGRVTAARGRVRLAWLGGGAFAMGIGIWEMHFKGMLAFRLPVPVEYHWPTILAALGVAILASAIALHLASLPKMGWALALRGGVIMGTGIAGMHYLGMAAMRLPALGQYSPLLVTLSILLAILFSVIALLLAFDLREETRWTVPRRLGSAIVMGAAVSSMHYTGMAAASFIPAAPPDFSHTVNMSAVGNNAIAIVTFVVLVAAMVTASVDRRARTEIQKEAEDRLRLVIDTTPALLYSACADGDLDYFNKRWLEYLGLPIRDIIGWGWTAAVHPEDVDDLVGKWRSSLATGKPYEAEARVRRADGEYRWMLHRKVPARDDQGNIIKWYGSSVDIEDRRRAEDAVRRSEEHLRLVIDTAPAMLHSARPDGYVDFFNKRWLEYVGVSLEDIRGWGWTNAMHPEDVENVVGKWRSSVATGKPFEAEARLRRADGEYRLMLLRKVPLRDETGSIVKWYGSATDIEDRKRAEQELRQAEEHIRAILEYSPNWIFLKDTEGRYLLVNREIERVFCIGQEQIKGKTDSDIFPPEQAAEYRANDLKVLRAGLAMEFEEIALLEDGPHTSIVHKFPLFDTHGNIYATGGVATDITERKRTEEARRYSDEQYRTVVETATDAVVSIDEDSKILFVNPATSKIFGYHTSELIGRPLMMLMPESLRSLHEAGFRRYLATGQRHLNWQGTELPALRKNGQEFPVEVSFGEMTSNGHRVFTGFIRDISEKKRAEDELRKQKEVLQKIFENIPVMIVLLDQGGRHELVNPEWERTIGWTLGEIRERNLDIFAEAFPDAQYRQVVMDDIAASTGEWTDLKVRVRDGRVVDVAATFVHLSDGSSLFIGRDIAERKRVEAELRESEARFRLVADSAPVMIWMSGTDKLCTYFNKPWLDFTGRPIDRELGNGWADGVHPEDLGSCMDMYIQAFDLREAFRMEYRLRRRDGEYRWVSDIGVPRFNPDGSFAGYIGSCIDVTEQRLAEEQLRQAQGDLARVTRVVAMGELAAAIAHEVNQPLTAIVTNGQFCLRRLDGSNPDELRAVITEIVNDGTRASAVISRVRGLLRKGAPNRTEIDMNQIIQDVTMLLRNEFTRNRLFLRTELAADLPRVPGDPVLLQQVLINLMMNAIDAMRTSTDGRREILIRSARNPDGVLVQVQDSGPGIAPEEEDRIFEPFFTTKPEGIGMGLSISHSIIESHGGRLWTVPSSTGALFEFTLPTDRAGES